MLYISAILKIDIGDLKNMLGSHVIARSGSSQLEEGSRVGMEAFLSAWTKAYKGGKEEAGPACYGQIRQRSGLEDEFWRVLCVLSGRAEGYSEILTNWASSTAHRSLLCTQSPESPFKCVKKTNETDDNARKSARSTTWLLHPKSELIEELVFIR